jgi:hypothetical protein
LPLGFLKSTIVADEALPWLLVADFYPSIARLTPP